MGRRNPELNRSLDDHGEKDLQLRLAKARAHPLRSQLLDLIAVEPAAASELEAVVDSGMNRIGYHLGRLCKLKIIEPDHHEEIGAAKKTTYRIRGEVAPAIQPQRAHLQATDGVRVVSASLLDLLLPSAVVIVSSSVDLKERHRMTARTVVLDEMAREELASLVRNAKAGMREIEQKAAARLAVTKSLAGTVSIVCLDSLT